MWSLTCIPTNVYNTLYKFKPVWGIKVGVIMSFNMTGCHSTAHRHHIGVDTHPLFNGDNLLRG